MIADQPERWPAALLKLVDDWMRAPWTAERLGGMSVSRVHRIRGGGTSAILKISPSAAEHRFYRSVAPELRRAGVGIPQLFDAAHMGGCYCLLLEDIPNPLPVKRGTDWRPDEQVIAMLARLHHTTHSRPVPAGVVSTWSWNEGMTHATLGQLAASAGQHLAGLLMALEAESQGLFEPECWISGDPNPLNWGLRADGTPVLFDWELFGPGAAAIDLAVSVPGLGDQRAFVLTAAAYTAAIRALTGEAPAEGTLPRRIAVAKVAGVVQLLHAGATGSANISPDVLSWLSNAVPAWVIEVCSNG